MWVAQAPAIPISWASTATRKPWGNCLALSVSAKFQRRKPRPPPQNDVEGSTGVVKSNVNKTPPSMNISTNNNISRQAKQSEEQRRQLSGSDVLWALQRAAAAQKTNKKRRDSSSTNSTSQHRKDTQEEEEEATMDYSNVDVRPLCIKNQWSSRLDEMESRLRELIEDT